MTNKQEEINYPRFISNKPCGEDKFKNSPHESIAKTLKELICNSDSRDLKNPVIGLDGNWGSGKSNTIKILEDKLKADQGKYFVFTYDVWGHQEDLTRLSFLEEIIEWALTDKCMIKNKEKWKDKDKKLSAKFKKSNRSIFPKIKLMYLWIALIPLSTTFINVISESIVKPSALITYSELKLIITSLLLLFTLISLIFNIKKLYKENHEEKAKCKTPIDRLKFLIECFTTSLYFFSGKEIKSEINEYVLEDEPSVKRFNLIFNEFITDIDGDGLIVVFDNMDRLSNKDKLMSIWSSIHTFFAEIKSDIKVWTIIPYDKSNLSILQDETDAKSLVNEFINKTFFLTIRIPDAIYDNWKEYFSELLDKAFGENNLPEETKEAIETLFALKMKSENDGDNKTKSNVTPRIIVSFINDIVALSILKQDIDTKFIALYSLVKDIIVNNYSVMIDFNGIKQYSLFFDDSEELSKNLAAIYYNIDKETAKSILYERKIDDELKTISNDFSDSIKNSSFWNWFKKIIPEKDLQEFKFDNLVSIFNVITNTYPLDPFKNVFSKKTLESLKESDVYKKEHDNYIDSLSVDNASIYFNNIILTKNDYSKINDYCKVMDRLLDYKEHEKIKNKIKKNSLKLAAEIYINKYAEYKKDKLKYFDHLNLIIDEENLIKFFFENGIYNVSKLENIHIIKYLSNKSIALPNFKKENDQLITILPKQIKEIIDAALKVNRWLSKNPKEIKIPNAIETFNRYKALGAFNKESSDVICTLINLLKDQDLSASMPDVLGMQEVSNETIKIIQNYITYTDLIDLLVKYKSSLLLLQIVTILIKNNSGNNLDSLYVFKNILQIKECFSEETVFLNFLKDFERQEKKWQDIKYEQLTNIKNWLNIIASEKIEKFKSIKFIHEHLLEHILNLSGQIWCSAFKEKNEDYEILKALHDKNLLDTSLYEKKEFYDSIKEVTVGFLKNELDLDVEFIENIYKKIPTNIMNSCFNEIFQISNSSNPASFSKEKTQFILRNIAEYGVKITDYNSIVDNYLRKAIDDDSGELFNEMLSDEKKFKFFGNVIKNSTPDNTILKDSLNKAEENHENIKNFIKKFNLQKKEVKKEDKNNEN